ncbi:hypothetical protein F4821DRAFT_1698 [Hypoxylon rubiginosum]|uniref:Uncharacterized protein n=1 Tax=Hypoxylon rubiginosum TaxID=110542 RepID=A0ACC0DLS3_9PEZI|nr:hypothetical protein F4821DRAFT_1698 [Hypoxylon rubiginosum]
MFEDITHLNCGELIVESPAAKAETPGSCATDAVVDDVELGRDIGSRVAWSDGVVAGAGAGAGTAPVPVSSSMTDRIGGNGGDAVRVGIGSPIGGRLPSTFIDATAGDAVVGELRCPEKTRDYRLWYGGIGDRY